jgi:hypothetical protein
MLGFVLWGLFFLWWCGTAGGTNNGRTYDSRGPASVYVCVYEEPNANARNRNESHAHSPIHQPTRRLHGHKTPLLPFLSAMRLVIVEALALLGATPALMMVQGFSSPRISRNNLSTRSALPSSSSSGDSLASCSTIPATTTASSTAPFRAERVVNGVIFSGDPPEAAYEMNHYEILQRHSIRAPGNGAIVPFADLLNNAAAEGSNSHVVVFLRSLG